MGITCRGRAASGDDFTGETRTSTLHGSRCSKAPSDNFDRPRNNHLLIIGEESRNNITMGKCAPDNVLDESYPLFVATGLVGLRPFRICKTMIFGHLYAAILLGAWFALYWYTATETMDLWEKMSVYSLITSLRVVQSYTGLVFGAFTIISSNLGDWKIRKLYGDLEEVDEKLKLLNVRFAYGRAMRRDVFHLLEITICTTIFNLLEYFPLVGPETTGFFDLVWLVNSLPQFVNSIVIANFVIVIAKIRRRLETINELIPSLMIVEKSTVASTLEIEMNNVFRLKLLNRIHEKLIGAATILNDSHGPVLLASFAVYFLTACAHTRTIYLTAGDKPQGVDFLVEFLWLIFLLGKYIYVVDACHRVTVQVKRSGELIYERLTDTEHHPLKEEADSMARRVESRSLQLTACNFFVIDYSILKMIIVGLVVYVFFVASFWNISGAAKTKKM